MFLNRSRQGRALSAFNQAKQRWAPIPLPLHDPHRPPTHPRPSGSGKQTLSLTSWNIQASQSNPLERSQLILNHIFKGFEPNLNFPDIIFLQEVTSSVRLSLLNDPRVRAGFLTTDAEDDVAFRGVPFACMTLLSSKRFGSSLLAEKDSEEGGEGKSGSKIMLDSVFRTELPSRYARDALCVNITAPTTLGHNTVLRLLNIHLDSLDSHFRRTLQMHVLSGLLRETGCRGGIIGGDFNAIQPEDHMLVEKYGLVDAWVALHGNLNGSDGGSGDTWDVGSNLKDDLKPGRLDKILMLNIQPDEIQLLQPGLINTYTPWSDHCGLRCTFTI